MQISIFYLSAVLTRSSQSFSMFQKDGVKGLSIRIKILFVAVVIYLTP